MSTVQRITSKYKIKTDFNEVALNRMNDGFSEILRLDKFGILHSAQFKFNNRNILIEMYVDNQLVAEFDINDIDFISDFDHKNGTDVSLSFNDQKDVLMFTPRFPIMFQENFYLRAKASSNSISRKLQGYLIEYTEE